mmetsp:Transcript_28099/g.64835  ORF Transcript_28099/g.64835 Transcript_28099/m.64835 type:complete len:205 (-) Transcript_28099:82-696(-)
MGDAHRKGPARIVHLDRELRGLKDLTDNLVRSASVLCDVGNWGPLHFVLAHVIPAHFIHPGLQNHLQVRINRVLHEPSNAELVDVNARGVSIIEYHGVTKPVVRRAGESFLALQRGKQNFGERPRIVKIIQKFVASAGVKVGVFDNLKNPLLRHAGALLRVLSRPPRGWSLPEQPIIRRSGLHMLHRGYARRDVWVPELAGVDA